VFGTPDPALLRWIEEHNCLLVTNNRHRWKRPDITAARQYIAAHPAALFRRLGPRPADGAGPFQSPVGKPCLDGLPSFRWAARGRPPGARRSLPASTTR
jgi:hypothetical protein